VSLRALEQKARQDDARDAAAQHAPRGQDPGVPDLYRPELFINRELSLIAYNQRVLDLAADPGKPLLERVRSLYFFATNSYEFFMIRLSNLQEQVVRGLSELSPDGMTASEQLTAIREQLLPSLKHQCDLLRDDLLPELAAHGIRIVNIADVSPEQRAALDRYYEREVFPVLTPLAVDPGHPFPHISNLSLNLAVAIDDKTGKRFARLKIPNVLPRFIVVPPDEAGEGGAMAPSGPSAMGAATTAGLTTVQTFVPLEQLIAANLDDLFPGMHVVESYAFQVIRDADVEIAEDEASDLSLSVSQALTARRFGSVVCLFIEEDMPEDIRALLMTHLEIGPNDIYAMDGLLALDSLTEIFGLDRSDLKYPPFQPRIPAALRQGEDIFAAIARQDILLHHPYESFTPVVDLLEAAARDPNVLAIKQTLYRVGGSHAPVVDALLAAAQEGTQVAVLVELKARFDEENNIEWARALEQTGAHVVYGLLGLKTHAKLMLIVRKERDGLRRYVHLGTGNYNAGTARGYTDLGLLTVLPAIGQDVTELFNYLTGYSHQDEYRKLLVAPVSMRRRLMRLIERETAHGDKGRIVFKMNALVDPGIIMALYRASMAGVRVDLIVRGPCCLRPGLPGVSENVRVVSLVGRFLEHSRIYYFRNGGAEEVYLGSADMMPRNLDRRVEELFPVEDARLRKRVIRMLAAYRRDRANASVMHADGSYKHLSRHGKPAFDAQAYFLTHDD